VAEKVGLENYLLRQHLISLEAMSERQKFSRHRDVRVIERYDDNRNDLAGQVARQLAATVPAEPPAA
jgi:hypothetical protein